MANTVEDNYCTKILRLMWLSGFTAYEAAAFLGGVSVVPVITVFACWDISSRRVTYRLSEEFRREQ